MLMAAQGIPDLKIPISSRSQKPRAGCGVIADYDSLGASEARFSTA